MRSRYKILTVNLNGLRGSNVYFMNLMTHTQADILCVQETKVYNEYAVEFNPREYSAFAVEGKLKNQGGVVNYYKPEPLYIASHASDEMERGRVIIMEYTEMYIINIYLPHSGNNKQHFDKKIKWYEWLINLCEKLDARKPLVLCGDYNTATYYVKHNERAKFNSSAGWITKEQEYFKKLLSNGFTDAVSYMFPSDEAIKNYLDNKSGGTYISNYGHRVDYILLSNRILKNLVSADIHTGEDVHKTSDWHLPVEIVLEF